MEEMKILAVGGCNHYKVNSLVDYIEFKTIFCNQAGNNVWGFDDNVTDYYCPCRFQYGHNSKTGRRFPGTV